MKFKNMHLNLLDILFLWTKKNVNLRIQYVKLNKKKKFALPINKLYKLVQFMQIGLMGICHTI